MCEKKNKTDHQWNFRGKKWRTVFHCGIQSSTQSCTWNVLSDISITMWWSYIPAAVAAFGQRFSLWCDSPEWDLNRYLLYLFSVLHLFIFLPPFSPLHSFTSRLPPLPVSLSPLSISSIFLLLSFPLLPSFSIPPSLPLPSKGPNSDKNSNNVAQLCANSLLTHKHTHTHTHTHTHSCCLFTNPFHKHGRRTSASSWQSKDQFSAPAMLRCQVAVDCSVITYFLCFN